MTLGTLNWRWWLGKPDGILIRLRCQLIGHRWWQCEPECCNRSWCERCLTPGKELDGNNP